MRNYATVSTGLYALVVACLLAVFLTYRSFNDLFYVNWMAGVTVIAAFSAVLLSGYQLSRSFFYTLALVMVWTVWAAFITPWATDIGHHIKYLVVSSFYLMASCAFSYLLLNRSSIMPLMFSAVMWVWLSVNGLLLVAFFVGIYQPAKGDFSGVFHDRNVFSITTVIVLALYLAFRFPVARIESMVAGLMVYLGCALMILVSKSITGYLGVMLITVIFAFRLSTVNRFFLLSFGLMFFIGVVATANPISERIERFYMAANGQMGDLRESESAYVRKYLLEEGVKLASENLFVGVGLDNAREHVKWPGKDTGSFLHNTYLDIATSGGVVLFVLYYLPVFYGFACFLLVRQKVNRMGDNYATALWYAGFSLIALKLLYDLTWTTYFEFAMVFSVVFSLFLLSDIKRRIRFA